MKHDDIKYAINAKMILYDPLKMCISHVCTSHVRARSVLIIEKENT